jgi:hypothetical protein
LSGYRSEFSEFRAVRWAPKFFEKKIPEP